MIRLSLRDGEATTPDAEGERGGDLLNGGLTVGGLAWRGQG